MAPELLLVQGELSDDLYILTAGNAIVTIQSGEVVHQLAVLHPGDVIGELAALDRSPRTATVRPEGEMLRVLRIAGSDFRRLFVRLPHMAPLMMSTISVRLRRTYDVTASWS